MSTDHAKAKEYAEWLSTENNPSGLANLARAYLDLTAQLAAKDAVIGELVEVACNCRRLTAKVETLCFVCESLAAYRKGPRP